MAFWNAPVGQTDHAARAIARARAAPGRPRERRLASRLAEARMRGGIGTGPAVVGNVGSNTKFNYTGMGDTNEPRVPPRGRAQYYGAPACDRRRRAAAGGAVPGSGTGPNDLREGPRLSPSGVRGSSDNLTSEPRKHCACTRKASRRIEPASRGSGGTGFDAAHRAGSPMTGRAGDARAVSRRSPKSPTTADWRGEHV